MNRVDSLLKAYAKRCAYCGAPFVFGEGKTIDHISPKSKNQDESGTNKVVCCQKCNSLKSNMPLKEFRKIVDAAKLEEYLKDFGGLQLPTGEIYEKTIRKRFRLR